MYTVLQYGHSTSAPRSATATLSRAWHVGHGAISTGAFGSAAGAGGGAGGETGTGGGAAGNDGADADGSGAGMTNWAWHFGHLPVLPPLASSTV